MNTKQPRVIIVGGSLGGLSTALFLRDIGCTVEILERSAGLLTGRGAGIVLSPYTVRYFTLRERSELEALSVTSRWMRYIDSNGTIVAETAVPYRFSSYNAIYKGLLDAFGMENYHLASEMVNFDQDEAQVTVQLADGRTLTGDLLVCADGIRSKGRSLLLPGVELDYAGYVAWRGILSEEEVPPDIFRVMHDAITYHILPQSHVLTYPIPVVDRDPEDDVQPYINWLWYRNVSEGPELDTLMTDRDGKPRDVSLGPGAVQPKFINRMERDAATQLPQILSTLILRTREPFIQAITDCAVPRMAFGRVCLIGDGAFVARPHAAAGTAKAVEDGWQLSLALKDSAGDVRVALQEWEPKQLEMGQAILDRSRDAGNRVQVENSWSIGDPLPFGLYKIGDSEMP